MVVMPREEVRLAQVEPAPRVLFLGGYARSGSTIVDRAIGSAACERLARATAAINRRIVLITPAERHEIAPLKEAGFNGYLVKPVRFKSFVDLVGFLLRFWFENSRAPSMGGISRQLTAE